MVFIHDKNTAYIANAGDSFAYVIYPYIEMLTEVHKASEEAEAERILKTDAELFRGRINGEIAVSRSIGDSSYTEYGLIHTPFTRKLDLTPGMLIVLASDGLWDKVTPEDILTIKDLPVQQISAECLNTAIERESTDNTTIIVIKV